MTFDLNEAPVLVIGAGIMGAGIAQVAAQAGHPVMLYDAREGAAAQAKATLSKTLDALVAKGKLTAQSVVLALSRIEPITALESACFARLVVEAIIEKIDAKRALFRDLEAIVSPDCILATNTSSISVTAIANGLQYPGRVVGMHFFNPVALMKLVEVVSGLQTEPAVADSIFALSKVWGKEPVHARSTPGFIVNRIARPYYAETLALLQENAGNPAVLDACLRGAGFRMGPCELMDLIGHDTNFSVTQSVFEANFYDKRFTPSLVQRELVDGGLLGRKSGRGFFDYVNKSAPTEVASAPTPAVPAHQNLAICGQGRVADLLSKRLAESGVSATQNTAIDWTGLQVDGWQLRLTDGRTATQLGQDVAVFDLPLMDTRGAALAYAISLRAPAVWTQQVPTWLQLLSFAPQAVADTPALVVARTVAMLINEAADAVHQGVCSQDGANSAMKLGVNYPRGPFEWLAMWDLATVSAVLDALDAYYRGERYRVSPGLRQQAWKAGAA